MLTTEDTETITRAVLKFESWLDRFGYLSYDHYDFWGSSPGVWSKAFFYRHRFLGAPAVIALQCLESFLPSSRVLFAKRKRFAIGDAHLALAFLQRHETTGEKGYLDQARSYIAHLINSATETDSGIGWGYPYTWVSNRGIYAANTPFITVTPYVFDAVMKLYEISDDESLRSILEGIARFAAFDIPQTIVSDREAASGYGIGDHSSIINASTYRAALLLKADSLFGVPQYREMAWKNINFVLSSQKENGSWLYAEKDPFIDNFHSCFVLKNLSKAHELSPDEHLISAIRKGYAYYRKQLFRENGSPIHFSVATHKKFRKIEMYDYAEGILLGITLNNQIRGAADFSLQLAKNLISRYQLPDGHFVTRVSSFNTRNKTPYLRWPQAQLYHSLCAVLAADHSITPQRSGEKACAASAE